MRLAGTSIQNTRVERLQRIMCLKACNVLLNIHGPTRILLATHGGGLVRAESSILIFLWNKHHLTKIVISDKVKHDPDPSRRASMGGAVPYPIQNSMAMQLFHARPVLPTPSSVLS